MKEAGLFYVDGFTREFLSSPLSPPRSSTDHSPRKQYPMGKNRHFCGSLGHTHVRPGMRLSGMARRVGGLGGVRDRQQKMGDGGRLTRFARDPRRGKRRESADHATFRPPPPGSHARLGQTGCYATRASIHGVTYSSGACVPRLAPVLGGADGAWKSDIRRRGDRLTPPPSRWALSDNRKLMTVTEAQDTTRPRSARPCWL